MHYDLGYIDPEQRTPQTIASRFGAKSYTYVSGEFCYPCVRSGPLEGMVRRPGLEPGTHGLKGRCSTN